MVDKTLVIKLKEMIELGAKAIEPDDILKIFEMHKQISEEVEYLKQDLNEEEMACQIVFSDIDKRYWVNASNGKVEYGEGNIKKPPIFITASKEDVMGLFLGEIDANIISPLGRLKAGGNIKTLRAFQEYYEDAIEEFKKRY